MNTNSRRLVLALVGAFAIGATTLPAQARDALLQQGASARTDVLRDGSTLYVFADGKMALEDKFGRAVRVNPGAMLETKDGRKVTFVGDEVARLDGLLNNGHRN